MVSRQLVASGIVGADHPGLYRGDCWVLTVEAVWSVVFTDHWSVLSDQ